MIRLKDKERSNGAIQHNFKNYSKKFALKLTYSRF